MFDPIMADKIQNIRAMAENVMKCPANEQNLAHFQEFVAQALRDVADCLHTLKYNLVIPPEEG